MIRRIQALSERDLADIDQEERQLAANSVRLKTLTANEEGKTRDEREHFALVGSMPSTVGLVSIYDDGRAFVLISDRKPDSTGRPKYARLPVGRYRIAVRLTNDRSAHGLAWFEIRVEGGGLGAVEGIDLKKMVDG
jgi:hypothetical protein